MFPFEAASRYGGCEDILYVRM